MHYKNSLPEIGFLRIKEILKIFPIGKSTWWDGVKEGRFPKPVKIGIRTTAWKVEDIARLLKNIQISKRRGKKNLLPKQNQILVLLRR